MIRTGRSGWVLSVGILSIACAATASAAEQGKNVADTDGLDFKVQGEYLGEVVGDGSPVGAHIIALGNDEFRVVAYEGGLPGDGWSRGDTTHHATGKIEGDKAVFTAEDGETTAEWKDGALTVRDGGGNVFVEMKKVERKSRTLGKKPVEGAVVLFDGSDVEQFENATLVDGKYLGATNCYSKMKLGDHQLHIEFRTPYMPQARGQGRGNSGVYIQSRYELQVLDSFGLKGENNECGGIYSISKPAVNMCYPPMSWQTYDIDFTAARYDDEGKKTKNARVTIEHNGVVIHDDIELTHGTPGRHEEGPEPDALFLQDHSNPVVFRNIWVKEK